MKVKILTPVNHDGQLLVEGDYADMSDKAAAALFEVGAAEPAGKNGKPGTKAPADPADPSTPSDPA